MAYTLDYFVQEFHANTDAPAMKLPVFEPFVLQVVNILDASPGSFWRCRDALAALSMSRAALEFVEAELITGLSSRHHISRLKLLECDRLSLSLRHVPPKSPATTLSASVEHRMIGIVHGVVQIHRFEQPQPEPLDVFEPDRKIVPVGTTTIGPGSVLECRAAVDCYELTVTEDALVFEMRSEPLYRFQWLYDAATLAPKRVVFTDPQDMRAELALLTAMNLQSRESIPSVRRFLTHPNYVLRWSAVKALVQLDSQNAVAHLNAAALDNHPQIRAAANRCKRKLEELKSKVENGAHVTN